MRRMFPCIISLALWLMSCTGSSTPQPLEEAMQAAEQMISPGVLERSAFYALFPNGTPKQFVSYIFSDIGAAERPPQEGGGELNLEEEKSMRRVLLPVWPAGVSMTHSIPDPALGMQVVWKWDNGRRMIVLEGYVKPDEPPVVVREKELPVVQASEIARLAAKSQIEMGAKPQAF